VQLKFALRIYNSMSSIIAAGKPYNYLSLLRQHIDNLTFPLIPPLRTNYNNNWHISTYYFFYFN
jgi:hypothetical protein